MTSAPGRWGVRVGVLSAVVGTAVFVSGLRRYGKPRPGPADLITYVRLMAAATLAGLAVQTARDDRRAAPASAGTSEAAASAIPVVAAGALILDAVDGPVARRTGTVSAFGARADGETDAVLILVLSLHAARRHGWWVATGGLARYAFAAAGAVWPWLRRPLPFRYWRKVATAGEGIALAVASVRSVPRFAARAGLVVGLGLIAESFGRDVVWLWRRRDEP